MFSNQKKAYISVQCDYDFFQSQRAPALHASKLYDLVNDKKAKLEIKGPFSWTSYSDARV